MKVSTGKEFAASLKDYVSRWLLRDLIFSYELIFSHTTSGPQLILKQKQTQIKLSMTIHAGAEEIQIDSFTLLENPQMRRICPPLYDAALIEIVLQGLLISIYSAQQLDKEEVRLMLTTEDAAHIWDFDTLFTSAYSQLTLKGKRDIFTLSICGHHLGNLYTQINNIKADLYKQLWVMQRDYNILKRYLQHSCRSDISLLKIPQDTITDKVAERRGNIILFPRVLPL
ncbi:hypothetical protein [Candidatus Odyssella thessalonicensis]|uniref:hypothetical protein n=1 Tax=Candidatus Odyssella thessalonicensis TaxID=84647 RepID=UPI000225BB3B|nr:hypothetical protein [Candidatus Odyssella thessalonicensis]